MQRSWRPKDNAVNNLKPRSRFEENGNLLVGDLPTDRGRSHRMWAGTFAQQCSKRRHTGTDSFWPNTCTTSHWYSNEKNKWQSKHSKYLLQTTGQRRALGQKALPALNPILNSLTVTQTKISQRQLAISTGATLVIPAVSHPKQLTVFFRAQANIMPQPPCVFENSALSLHLETLFPWHTCWCTSGAREACGF